MNRQVSILGCKPSPHGVFVERPEAKLQPLSSNPKKAPMCWWFLRRNVYRTVWICSTGTKWIQMVPGWKKSGGYSGSTIVGQVSFEISYPGYGVWFKILVPRFSPQNVWQNGTHPAWWLVWYPDQVVFWPRHRGQNQGHFGPMFGSCGKLYNQKAVIWRWLE